jgi:antitoxin (DNA-binding transcriptional repressor) of toxin-antitoxin stability system
MVSRISLNDANARLPDLVNRVKTHGDEFVIEQGGEALCRLTAVQPKRFTGADFIELMRTIEHPDPGFADDVEDAVRNQGTVPPSPWDQ